MICDDQRPVENVNIFTRNRKIDSLIDRWEVARIMPQGLAVRYQVRSNICSDRRN